MKPLTYIELEEAFKNKQLVIFHPEFNYEAWKDGARGPLTLTHLAGMSGFYFIGYRCSDKDCHACTSKDISYELCGHHQQIKDDGFHIYDKVEFIETKKSTQIKTLSNPVFIRQGENNGNGT